MANAASSADAGGILPRKYKSGSIIYFEGDKSEYIYILKSGRVILTSTKPDTGEEVKEDVRMGEFFGVKSSLGKYPREETAQTVGETVILVMGVADFEHLILRNVNIVRKMLRVFSNQLRRIHKMVRSVLGEGEAVNPDAQLFKIGEYYYNAGVFQQANYTFKKFMEYYPDSALAAQAMQKIKAIASGQAASERPSIEPLPSRPVYADSDEKYDGGDNEEFGNSGKSSKVVDTDTKSPLSNEMEDFLADRDELHDEGGLDDFMGGGGALTLSEKFSSAMEKSDSGDYEDAIDLFKEILQGGNVLDQEDRRIVENAQFEIGMAQFKSGKMKEAFDSFSAIVKKYPKYSKLKNTLFHMGKILESVRQIEKARTYYTKVATMPPKDKISEEASLLLSKL